MSEENQGGIHARVPVVRHFIACERIEPSPDGKHFTLHKVIHAIQPLPGAVYPRIHPEIQFFVQMSDGQGIHRFQVELVFLDSPGNERSIWTTKSVKLDMGNDPLKVFAFPIRLQNLWFERAGLFEFRLFCDGQEIAREPILLKDTP